MIAGSRDSLNCHRGAKLTFNNTVFNCAAKLSRCQRLFDSVILIVS